MAISQYYASSIPILYTILHLHYTTQLLNNARRTKDRRAAR